MFRFLAKLRFKRLHKQLLKYGEINQDNWSKYKAIFVESMRMACKADTNCSDNILYWNMLANFRRYQDEIKAKIPTEYYTDLFVTLRELSRTHHPEIWAMLDKISEKKQT